MSTAAIRRDRSYVLSIGFGTTVAMWAVGYVCRIPPAAVPSWLVLLLLLLCQLGGGFVTGRRTGAGWRAGAAVGALSGALNLLVLGSLLSGGRPNSVVPSALWWIPGSILTAVVLGASGAAAGSPGHRAPTAPPNETGALARVAVGATFLLLIVGGVVTSQKAGLSVVDWPNSYGYGMFLYPLSRMTGGVYYEHAHRLIASLVGLTTLVLAIRLQRVERRTWLKRFGWLAVLAVVIQGLLGGLRVTGRFTMSRSPLDTQPSIGLAVVHGVLAQVFFAMIVAIAVFTTSAWKSDRARSRAASAGTDQALAAFLTAIVIVQIVLGAIQRHLSGGLLIHITMAAFVLVVAIATGARAWGFYRDQPILQRLGRSLIHTVTTQIVLGILALIARGASADAANPSALSVVARTAHQAVGAMLLAISTMLMLWSRRLLAAKSPA